jgi:hypothetical protein
VLAVACLLAKKPLPIGGVRESRRRERMAVSHKAKPAAAVTANGPCKSDRLAGSITPRNIIADLKAQRGRLFDRYGCEREERVLKNWSPEACIVMGLHRVDDGGEP